MNKEQRKTVVISSIILAVIIITSTISVVILERRVPTAPTYSLEINNIIISEFGSLANLDPEGYQVYGDMLGLNINDSADIEHTTYRIVADNMTVKVNDSESFVSIRITENGYVNELKQWFLRDEDLSPYMSEIVGDKYTHFEFQEIFDIGADIPEGIHYYVYYILQMRIVDDRGVITMLNKFFTYMGEETVVETPTETPMGTPAVVILILAPVTIGCVGVATVILVKKQS